MLARSICAIALLAHCTMAANGTNASSQSINSFCNTTVGSANASGIFTCAVDYPLPGVQHEGQVIINIPDPSWAYTVNVQNNTVQAAVWYDTAGQNYSDDLSLGYDVCSILITGGLPINTIELGQNDPGDCSAMLSNDCRTALLEKTAASAHKWVTYASPPPYSNLSAGVLPTICGYILADLAQGNYQYPAECAQEFGYNDNINDPTRSSLQALTGFNDTILDNSQCTLSSGNKTFHSIEYSSVAYSDAAYDNKTRNIIPAIAVYMPVANINRQTYYSSANSTLRCLKANDYTAGSRIPSALPAGHAYRHKRSGLSRGAIAGIVVGIVALCAMVAGLLFWICLRRRRQAKAKTVDAAGEPHDHGVPEGRGFEKDGANITELPATRRETELDGMGLSEMHTKEKPVELKGSKQVAEMDSTGVPAELSATTEKSKG